MKGFLKKKYHNRFTNLNRSKNAKKNVYLHVRTQFVTTPNWFIGFKH